MIEFSSNGFTHGTTFLAALETSLAAFKWAVDTDGRGPIKTTFDMDVIEQEMNALIELLNRIELHDCAMELTRAKNALRRSLAGEADDPRPLLDSFRRRLHDALKRLTFIAVTSAERAMILPSEPLFGEAVHRAFPSAAVDISEAAKALTFTLFTACVFHCMRASEAALRCMARALEVRHENRNWGAVIDDIEGAIEGMTAATHGGNWRELRQFYAEAATHFRMLKDALRNHVMHSHVTYSGPQSVDIFNATRAFMQHASRQLHE